MITPLPSVLIFSVPLVTTTVALGEMFLLRVIQFNFAAQAVNADSRNADAVNNFADSYNRNRYAVGNAVLIIVMERRARQGIIQ